MAKREPQIILKTDERKIHLELGLEGQFGAKSTSCDENRVFLEGDRLEVSVKNGRWVLCHVPGRPAAPKAGAALLPRRRVTAQQRPGTALCCAVTSGVEAGNGVADEEAEAPRRREPNPVDVASG
jgi:hypothetical protein